MTMKLRLTLKPHFDVSVLLDLPIIMGVIWLCTQMFPDDIKIDGFGSLIVVSGLYFILITLALLLAFFLSACAFGVTTGFAVIVIVAFFVGVPILLLFNGFINGFWISDIGTAFLVSVFTTLVVTLVQSCIATFLKRR